MGDHYLQKQDHPGDRIGGFRAGRAFQAAKPGEVYVGNQYSVNGNQNRILNTEYRSLILFERISLTEIRPVIHIAVHVLNPPVSEPQAFHLLHNRFIFFPVKRTIQDRMPHHR